MNELALIWGGIIGFCIVMYVILDGFTLGTALLLPLINEKQRNFAMSVILPNWDGNQTWLVLGTAGLYGAFPLAFSLLLPNLYIPILIMGLALLFRGVAFEFRLKSKEHRKYWDYALCIGSLVATVVQGMVLGNFVEGFRVSANQLLTIDKGFVNYFSTFTAISLVFGYALLGATRLILKTEGDLRTKMYPIAMVCAAAVAFASIVVSIWTPFINAQIAERWLNINNWYFLAPLPILNGIAFLILAYSLIKQKDFWPYWMTVVLFICPYIGFAISLYPYIIPYQIPYWEAAAPENTLSFILIGAIIMLPVLIFYTGYAYYIFRGKVKDVISY